MKYKNIRSTLNKKLKILKILKIACSRAEFLDFDF